MCKTASAEITVRQSKLIYWACLWLRQALQSAMHLLTQSLCAFLSPSDLLQWSTTRQPCCWVVLVMLWDTGTSCGSTMSLDQLSTRSVQHQHGKRSQTTVQQKLVWGPPGVFYRQSQCTLSSAILNNNLQELKELGGLKNIKAELPDWPVSDDTVLHLATAEGLATGELQTTLNLFARPDFCRSFAPNKELIEFVW